METIKNEIKARIFAQYYYCQVSGKYIESDELAPIEIMNPCLVDYIKLTSLQQISDDDVIAVDIMEEWNGTETGNLSQTKIMICNGVIHNRGLKIKSYQYLQSKRYALPYMNYSVEDLVELGIFKLI